MLMELGTSETIRIPFKILLPQPMQCIALPFKGLINFREKGNKGLYALVRVLDLFC